MRVGKVLLVIGIMLAIAWPVYLHFKPMLDESALLNRAGGIDIVVKKCKSGLAINFFPYYGSGVIWGIHKNRLYEWQIKVKTTIRLYKITKREPDLVEGRLFYIGEARKAGSTNNYILIPTSTMKEVNFYCDKKGEKCQIRPTILISVRVKKMEGYKILDKVYTLDSTHGTSPYSFVIPTARRVYGGFIHISGET